MIVKVFGVRYGTFLSGEAPCDSVTCTERSVHRSVRVIKIERDTLEFDSGLVVP